MRKKDGYANYDESVFSDPCPVAESDEEIVRIVNAQYKLSEFTDRSNFKSYDELKKKLDAVLSGDTFAGKSAAQMSEEDRPVAQAPTFASKPAPTPSKSIDNDDDEDVMSYFKKIAAEE
jgi:hypothetical protein